LGVFRVSNGGKSNITTNILRVLDSNVIGEKKKVVGLRTQAKKKGIVTGINASGTNDFDGRE